MPIGISMVLNYKCSTNLFVVFFFFDFFYIFYLKWSMLSALCIFKMNVFFLCLLKIKIKFKYKFV